MTGRIVSRNGIPLRVPNDVYPYDGFYISYNDVDTAVYGSDTTALVIWQYMAFLVLNGNHVKAYQALDGSLAQALEYFKQHRHQINPRSDALPEPEEANE